MSKGIVPGQDRRSLLDSLGDDDDDDMGNNNAHGQDRRALLNSLGDDDDDDDAKMPSVETLFRSMDRFVTLFFLCANFFTRLESLSCLVQC